MKYFIFMLTFCDIYVIIIKTKIVYENFNELKSRGELDMRKKILATVLGVTICLGSMTGCAGLKREIVDMKSDWNGGMKRVITVYTADGKKIAEYKGKIDIDTNDGGYVKFDYKGKRYIYYNCFVESIAEID